ncbi:hypothetical protein [Azospirillum doebereinerae]|nr:hypothetical protein [Azospirillum doebereinerae]
MGSNLSARGFSMFDFEEALYGGLPKGGVSPVFSRIIKMIADQ